MIDGLTALSGERNRQGITKNWKGCGKLHICVAFQNNILFARMNNELLAISRCLVKKLQVIVENQASISEDTVVEAKELLASLKCLIEREESQLQFCESQRMILEAAYLDIVQALSLATIQSAYLNCGDSVI